MNEYSYQLNYSDLQSDTYNELTRAAKARKIIRILEDYYSGNNLNNKILLDVGSSTGYITNILSQHFNFTVGIDIDEKGVSFSQEKFSGSKLKFLVQDSMNIQFPDNTFDVVNCTQIYEHVPDDRQMMREIYRILKPGGICFFAAGNRIVLMEPHYKLPLLSIFPKFLSHKYVKLFKKADFYYETHRTYWGLRKLVSDFEVTDYTLKVIRDPVRFHATEMISDGSVSQKFFLAILKVAYWICPTYLWILKKPEAISQ